MPLNEVYRKSPPYVVSYDWTDIDGTGYIIYYGARTADSVGEDYILTRNTIFSSGIDTTGTTLDLDFDIEFNKPQRIKGNLFANIVISSGGATTVTAKVWVRKWDGSSETEIASKTSESTAVGANAGKILAVIVPITTEQIFKKGETLRITISTTTSGPALYLNHDPANRAGGHGITLASTQLAFHVPFVIPI